MTLRFRRRSRIPEGLTGRDADRLRAYLDVAGIEPVKPKAPAAPSTGRKRGRRT